MMLALVLLVAAATAAPAPAAPASAYIAVELERDVFTRTNAERARYHLPPLRYDEGLQQAAREHCDDMLRRGFFSHVNPEGESPSDRVAQWDRRLIGEAGENIWMGSGYTGALYAHLPSEIVGGFMKSPGHRANILREDFTHLGVGVTFYNGTVHAAQVFAAAAGFTATPVPDIIRSGQIISFQVRPEKGEPLPVQFDLSLRGGERRIVGPWTSLESARIEAPPGLYRLRFYFPDGGRKMWIHGGPQIAVR